ncbi:MAG: hypothetical protein LBH35_07905 [Treponema sp.]|nr:hypothetical protein [Treponema sp.]
MKKSNVFLSIFVHFCLRRVLYFLFPVFSHKKTHCVRGGGTLFLTGGGFLGLSPFGAGGGVGVGGGIGFMPRDFVFLSVSAVNLSEL